MTKIRYFWKKTAPVRITKTFIRCQMIFLSVAIFKSTFDTSVTILLRCWKLSNYKSTCFCSIWTAVRVKRINVNCMESLFLLMLVQFWLLESCTLQKQPFSIFNWRRNNFFETCKTRKSFISCCRYLIVKVSLTDVGM